MPNTVLTALAAATLALSLTSPVSAQSDNCRDDKGQDRCAEGAQARQRAAYGVPTIEALAARKVRTMRAFFIDGYGNEAGLVSVERAPAQEPRVEVRFADERDRAKSQPSLSTIIPVATWEELVAGGRDFERPLAPVAGSPPDICLHSWVVIVEAVDFDGRVRRRTEDACSGSLAIRYAFKLAAAGIKALPACAVLDLETTRNNVTRLRDCTLLDGDRAAAAQAYNVFRSTGFANPRGPDFARALQYLFFDRVEFAWPGVAPVTGSEKASQIWASRAAEQRFYPTRIFGETADRVSIEGVIQLDPGDGDRPAKQVPATMIWTRENGFGFRLRNLTSRLAS